MNFETLKQDNKRKYIVGSIIAIAILATITYIGTRAKYRVTNSVQLASGVINYSPSDLEIVAIKIQNDSNEYDNTDTVPTSGYTLNKELSVCKIGETKQDVTITYENGKINISNLTTKGTKCQLYFDNQKVGKDLILANNTIDTSRSSGYFPAAFNDNTAGKIFSAEDDDGTTYFFAGSNPNNWVQFGGFYWRIIRINGNGSVRIIYNGSTTDQTGTTTQIGRSAFNECWGDNTYVGFMYGMAIGPCQGMTSGGVSNILDSNNSKATLLPNIGSNSEEVKYLNGIQLNTYAETHTNTNSSIIKTYLDTWYNTNLKANYEQYIDINVGFCGDRSLSSGTGIGTTYTEYAPKKRVDSTYTATYKCSNNNDLYTVSTLSKGNKVLENPIGLITIDEVMYAGGHTSKTQNYWLKTGQVYWTMSPYFFDGYNAQVMVMSSSVLSSDLVNNPEGVRPVINLKADTLTLGNGSASDPYRVS